MQIKNINEWMQKHQSSFAEMYALAQAIKADMEGENLCSCDNPKKGDLLCNCERCGGLKKATPTQPIHDKPEELTLCEGCAKLNGYTDKPETKEVELTEDEIDALLSLLKDYDHCMNVEILGVIKKLKIWKEEN